MSMSPSSSVSDYSPTISISPTISDFEDISVYFSHQEIKKETTFDWRQNALQIVQILFNHSKSEPFQRAVDEKRDNAPKYYKTIAHPMDLGTLRLHITDNSIQSPKQFVKQLLLIWDNALTYNARNLTIYADAKKLKTLSHKLIKQYWPQQNVYEAKRKSSRIRENYKTNNKIAVVQNAIHCGECKDSLHLLRGFHVECQCLIVCNQCKLQIRDSDSSYYHCVSGCQPTNTHNKHHSVVLCQYCAHKINGNTTVFNGLFLDLSAIKKEDINTLRFWYEAITMKQNGNRVYYELIFSSETTKRWVTEAQIIENNTLQVVKSKNSTDFTKAVLSDDGLSLMFIDKEDPHNSDPNIFTKAQIQCGCCGAQCVYMRYGMLPMRDALDLYCDMHHILYKTEEKKHKSQRCLSFKQIEDEHNNSIYRQDFYFSCLECNEFDICQICTLIQYELEFKKKMKSKQQSLTYGENISEPPRKRQRVMMQSNATTNVIHCAQIQQYEKLHENYVDEKRRNQELKNELEKALLQNQKWELKCSRIEDDLLITQTQRDDYCKKLNQLKHLLSEFN